MPMLSMKALAFTPPVCHSLIRTGMFRKRISARISRVFFHKYSLFWYIKKPKTQNARRGKRMSESE